MASFLPFRPWFSPDPRVFGREAAPPPGIPDDAASSPALRRHHSVLPLCEPPVYRRRMSYMHRFRRTPAKASRPFSISGSEAPSFRVLFRVRVRSTLPYRPEVPHPRFGYPLCGLEGPRSLKASFSLQRSWAFPFRAFLPPGDRNGVSSAPSALALSHETFGASCRRFSGFLPPGEPCPWLRPGFLGQVGAACSLGFFRPLGLSLRRTNPKTFPFRIPPLVLCRPDLSIGTRRDLRVCSPDGLAFPSEEGAGPSDLPHRSSSATS